MIRPRFGILLSALLLAAMAIVPCVSAYQASSYGTYYSDDYLDTRSVAQTARSELSSMGYSSTYYGNADATDAYNGMAFDQVFFFDGHGDAGMMKFRKSTVSTFITADNPGYARISDYSYNSLNDMALAVYMSCNSANTGATNGNLMDESTSNGVDSVVGFSNYINSAQSGYWSGRFWYYLDEQYNINDAAVYSLIDTRSQYGWFNPGGMDSYVIRGSLSSTIDPQRAGY